MGDAFTAFLVALMLLAVLTRETFVVILLYLFVGSLVAGRWWSSQVVSRIRFHRQFDAKVFPGETISVQVEVENRSFLPAVWLRVQDYYPLELAEVKTFQQVISLGPRQKTRLRYTLKARKRGYYAIGPLHVTSGDLLGLSSERSSEGGSDYLTVYPRVIPLNSVKLPSRSPMGTLKTTQPIFEDPARPMGTRDYQAGDSLRRIDWKATASTGHLQTRLFEPSIALETMIFLNLNTADYHYRSRFDATELAIVAAASLGNWVVAQRQAVGMITNAFDPLAVDNQAVPLFPRKGRPHLMRILEILARARAAETTPFTALLSTNRVKLSWGTTLLIVTGSADQSLFDELIQARRAGLNPVLILCGEHPGHRQAWQMGKLFHIPVFIFLHEQDLDLWRR